MIEFLHGDVILNTTCRCHSTVEPGLVLDPFMGSGTVAIVAERLQRRWLGIELHPNFAAMTRERVREVRATQEQAALQAAPEWP